MASGLQVAGFRPGLHPAAVAPAGRPPPPQCQPGAAGQARPGYGHSRVCSHAHHPVLRHHHDHRSGGQHRHGHPADGVVQRPQRAHPAPAAAGPVRPCTGRGAAAPPVAAAAGDHGADAHGNRCCSQGPAPRRCHCCGRQPASAGACSQKTLPVAVAMIAKGLGGQGVPETAGLAAISAVAAHLAQVLIDSCMVPVWADEISRAAVANPVM
ncbi:hypothetical protein HaLaN_12315 [Haematococcus lacustris]|uniref:Uncharacterized protein n=1 Tax=Haematococcus lacustris TaxID=44745 RepID=A0A699Z9R5_HAELA|nr:hypothetical protein HaLaN_12315 [Haematococcus lacustris]